MRVSGASERCAPHGVCQGILPAVAFPASEAPLVSIVIPAFNHWRYTNACLRAIAAAHDPTIATEIVVVDDGSTDRTVELLQACTGIR